MTTLPTSQRIVEWFTELELPAPQGEDLRALAEYAQRLPLTIDSPTGEQTRDFR